MSMRVFDGKLWQCFWTVCEAKAQNNNLGISARTEAPESHGQAGKWIGSSHHRERAAREYV